MDINMDIKMMMEEWSDEWIKKMKEEWTVNT